MRALRVGKLTIAALSQACRSYLSDKSLVENNPVFYFLHRKDEEKREIAVTLKDELAKDRLPPKSQRAQVNAEAVLFLT